MTAWSFSKLNNYEICPKKHYHYDIAQSHTNNISVQVDVRGCDVKVTFKGVAIR